MKERMQEINPDVEVNVHKLSCSPKRNKAKKINKKEYIT